MGQYVLTIYFNLLHEENYALIYVNTTNLFEIHTYQLYVCMNVRMYVCKAMMHIYFFEVNKCMKKHITDIA